MKGEYCRRQGYEILERFHEEGESAKSTDRSQLQNLLTFCRLNKGRLHLVVVLNLTRFARDKYDHCALRSHLQSLGISLRSATVPIDDTSTGTRMEGVLAAFAQFDNDVSSDGPRANGYRCECGSCDVPRRRTSQVLRSLRTLACLAEALRWREAARCPPSRLTPLRRDSLRTCT